MTSTSLSKTSARSVKADVVVIGVHSSDGSLVPASGAKDVAGAYGKGFTALLEDLGASAKVGDVVKLPGRPATKASLTVVVGLGDQAQMTTETLRRAAGAAIRSLNGRGGGGKGGGGKSVALSLPAESDAQVRAVVEGALLGAYAYDAYLTKKHQPVGDLVVLTPNARSKTARAEVDAAVTVAAAVNFARDLVNDPPNALYPQSLAERLQQRAKGTKVSVSVLDEQELTAQGYGGIIGVGQGSARPPRLVTLTYAPSRPAAKLAYVGKGITFDSGGLSIKPAAGMGAMKSDMSGAAAVAAAIFAIADLGLPVAVTAYASLAENMPSGSASRPGDVLTMYGGKTVEVLNTDAEGRLVLADAITTANATAPDLIVDVATLTGACLVALGDRVSGVFSNDDKLLEELPHIAETTGEAMWPLPIPDEMHDKVRTTKIADLSQHNPELWGGALYAAAFLREFVGDGITWAHLDIAGPAWNDGAPHGYTPKGGTGAAVRTLVALAQQRARS
ncbi:MAG: leucyl aminopeptidase [Nocardioidaceae bacterium]